MSRVQPGEVAAQLPAEPPLHGGDLGDIVADLDRVVMPGITHWNHPGFLHYFPSNSDLSSVLADLVSSGLGVQGMSWQTSPAATEVEDVVMEWLREMVGLPDTFTGVIEDTASTSTFTALLCARERTSEFSPEPRRPAGRGRAARGVRERPGAQLRSPRRRCSPASAPSTCASSRRTTSTRSGWTCWSAPSRTTSRPAGGPAPWWPPSARPPPRRSTRWPASPPCASATASGCTSTRRSPARR